jgi:flotillin
MTQLLDFIFSPIPAVILALIFVALIGLLYAKSVYKNAGADEALVITGRRPRKTVVNGETTEESGIKIVHGSGVFLTPFFQKSNTLSLRSRAIEIQAKAQDSRGVTLTVDAVAIVKVGERADAIRAAAQRFLGQEKNIDSFAQEVLSGSLRASIGATDVATIINKRDELGLAVLNVARESLINQGLDVDSFEIKGIHDENGYIEDLGRAEQARVRLLAEVAETNATREATEAKVSAEQAVAEANNTLALRKAALQLDTDRATAEAAAARPLAEAQAQQAVITAQQETAKRNADLRKAQLESEINAVADAEAYKLRVESEAAAAAAIAKATGDRDARAAAAQAVVLEANGNRDARLAAAGAVEAEGLAEAAAIRAKGEATAASIKAEAEALAVQSDALIQLRIIETLPLIAREIAAPMGNIDQLTVISTDGASALSKSVASGIGETDQLMKSLTGVGLTDIIKNFVGGAAGGAAAGRALAGGQSELLAATGGLIGAEKDASGEAGTRSPRSDSYLVEQ